MQIRRSLLGRWPLALVLAGATACALIPIDVVTQPSDPARVAAAKTFSLVPPEPPDPALGEPLEDAIRTTLSEIGLEEAPLAEAEIAVSYRAHREEAIRIRSEPDPDTQGYRVREPYIENTIEIAVSDARSEELLWRGIATAGVVSEATLPSVARRGARKILAEWPTAR